jgi:lantibiotic modifying enzyme
MTTCLKAHTQLAGRPRLPAPLRARALDTGREVLERLSDRPCVIETATAARSVYPNPTQPGWTSVDPATGDAGLALAYGFLGQIEPDERWEACAHTFLVPAVNAVAEAPFQPLGLAAGMAGLAFTVRYLSQGRRHRKVLAQLDAHLINRTRHLLEHVPVKGGVFPESYDAVYGFAGIGRYLLRVAQDNPEAEAVLRDLLATLVRWSEMPPPDGFWTPPGKARPLDLAEVPEKIHGYLTFGLAHGIPGPLALFALAHEAGLTVSGLHGAAQALVTALQSAMRDTPWGPDVPYHRFLASDLPPQASPSRAAWCYGNPGVARAIQLAARAFGEATWFELAGALMRSAMSRPKEAMQAASPTFCHGNAGLAQLLLRFLEDRTVPEPRLEQAFETRVCRLLEAFDPNAPFGYRNIESGFEPNDDPGLLSGAAGVALTLLSVASETEPVWDELVLVS